MPGTTPGSRDAAVDSLRLRLSQSLRLVGGGGVNTYIHTIGEVVSAEKEDRGEGEDREGWNGAVGQIG